MPMHYIRHKNRKRVREIEGKMNGKLSFSSYYSICYRYGNYYTSLLKMLISRGRGNGCLAKAYMLCYETDIFDFFTFEYHEWLKYL